MNHKFNNSSNPEADNIRNLMTLFFEGRTSATDEQLLMEAAHNPKADLPDDLRDDLEFLLTLNSSLASHLEQSTPSDLENKLTLHINRLAFRSRFNSVLRISSVAAVALLVMVSTLLIIKSHTGNDSAPLIANVSENIQNENPVADSIDEAITDQIETSTSELPGNKSNNKPRFLAYSTQKQMTATAQINEADAAPTVTSESETDDSQYLEETTAYSPQDTAENYPKDNSGNMDNDQIYGMVSHITVIPLSYLNNIIYNLNESFSVVSQAFSCSLENLSDNEDIEPEVKRQWREI